MTVRYGAFTLEWLGYATTRVTHSDGPTVYTDPGRYGVLSGEWQPPEPDTPHPYGPGFNAQDGDLVLVTHDHHYDDDGVRRVTHPDGTVLVYEDVDADRIHRHRGRSVTPPEDLPYDVRRVQYGDNLTIDGVEVTVVPAYNRRDGPWGTVNDGEPLHPRGFGCGYTWTHTGTTFFWTGDSDVIPEHNSLAPTVFLPSIARSYTMNRHDAADLAETLRPDLVLPIHYNTFDALTADSRAFAADLASRSIPVALDEHPQHSAATTA